MALKPGDRVSVSLSPIISLSQYVNLKPHASVSRDVPEDVDAAAFLEELTQDVRELCYHALAQDLGVMNELSQAIADGTDLTELLKEKINHVPARQVVEAPTRNGTSGPRRKVKART